MIDKSVPYAEVWMKRPHDLPVLDYNWPEGFSMTFYEVGDELAWAEIETSVAEFDGTKEALDYFDKSFAPYPSELAKRMVFITTDGGEKVGTATAWWKETEDGSRIPLVHWVAIKPAFQKKGLAKPLLSSVLKLFQHLEGDTPVFLKTQTWSHVAIQLYKKNGFEITDKNLEGVPNPEYEKAIEVLSQLYPSEDSSSCSYN